ncbi:MAG: hypothetical protein ACYSPI_04920 [Planctomycetota bacterium]|jgi:hypothetical protein
MHSYRRLLDQFDAVLRIGFVVIMATTALSFADEIMLKGGDVIHGNIIEQTEDAVLLEHEDLGQIKIASTRIASILVAPDGTTPPSDQAESETGPPAPRHRPASICLLPQKPEIRTKLRFVSRGN